MASDTSQEDRNDTEEQERSKLAKEDVKIDCTIQRTMHLPHLPWEILHLIFLRTVAPGWLIMPDRRYLSAWNVNTRAKLHLINVCRDWYEAGIELLYEEIAINSIGQLCALASTLRTHSSLADKVASLHLSFYIHDTTVYRRIYDSLPSLCPNLVKLGFSEFFSCPGMPPYLPSLHSLTHLELHSCSFVLFAGSIDIVAANLVSLSVYGHNSDTNDREDETTVEVQFPRLQVLRCRLDTEGLTFITERCKFPALKTFLGEPPSIFDMYNYTGNIFRHILIFIQHHGQRLTTLFLYYFAYDVKLQENAPFMAKVLAELVHLRHLIIPPFFDISVPQVLWLDCYFVWQQTRHAQILPLLSADERKNLFPNLQRFRCIDPGPLELPLIYVLLPPTLEDECHFSFPGIDIKCDACSMTGMSTAIREVKDDEEDLDFSSGSASECESYEPPPDSEESDWSDESEWASASFEDLAQEAEVSNDSKRETESFEGSKPRETESSNDTKRETEFLEGSKLRETESSEELEWKADEEQCLKLWRKARFAS
ncbi:hypothetical protein FB446DRAFT_739224 [Lentinula raphanica]|nr:hypothetical protein FB446DRAFT_739224 [Lentinula raphanica]